MALFYIVLNANDSIRSKSPLPPAWIGKRFALAVEAANEHDARALIIASFQNLSSEKDFGDVMIAQRHGPCWTLTLPDE
jgi:hypothetical protein